MGESGDMITLGAVAVLGYILIKKLEPAGDAISNTISTATETYKELKETVVEKVEKVEKSATTASNFAQYAAEKSITPTGQAVLTNGPWSDDAIAAFLGAKFADWIKGNKQGNTTSGDGGGGARTSSSGTSSSGTSSSGTSKTYHTGDTAYDKYIDQLTNDWEAKIADTKARTAAAKGSSSTGNKISLNKPKPAGTGGGKRSYADYKAGKKK